MLKLNIIVLSLLMQIIGSSGTDLVTHLTNETTLTTDPFHLDEQIFQNLIHDMQNLKYINENTRLKLEVNALSMEKMQSSMEKELAAVRTTIKSQCTEEIQQAFSDLGLTDKFSNIIQLLETKILTTVSSNMKSEISDLRNSLLSSRNNEIGNFKSSLTDTTKSEIENLRKSLRGEIGQMNNSIMTDVKSEIANLRESLLSQRKNEIADLENSLKNHVRNSSEIANFKSSLTNITDSEIGKLKSIFERKTNFLWTNITNDVAELRNSFKSDNDDMKNSIINNVKSEIQNISANLKDESYNLMEFVVNSSKIEIDNLHNILQPQISEVKNECSKFKDSLSGNVRNEINNIQMQIKSFSASMNSEMDDFRYSLPIRVTNEIGHLKATIQLEINRITNSSKSLETAVEVKFNKFENTLLQTKESLANLTESLRHKVEHYPSCVEALQNGEDSGIYKLYLPSSGLDPFDVYCLQDPENGPAWTVFQRRHDGSVDFYKNWQEYKEGFGDLAGEFFLGLEKLYALTNQEKSQQLWIKLGDWEGATRSARYTRFKIGNEMSKYTMTELGDYSGDAGNSLEIHKGIKFSTKDSDNDNSDSESCALTYKGAWWFRDCYKCHLNGEYLPEKSIQSNELKGILWKTWHGWQYSLKYTHMALRPSN